MEMPKKQRPGEKKNLADKSTQSACLQHNTNGNQMQNVYGIIMTGSLYERADWKQHLCVSVMAPVQDVIYCFIFNDWNGSVCVRAEPRGCLETRRWWLSNQPQSTLGSDFGLRVHTQLESAPYCEKSLNFNRATLTIYDGKCIISGFTGGFFTMKCFVIF